MSEASRVAREPRGKRGNASNSNAAKLFDFSGRSGEIRPPDPQVEMRDARPDSYEESLYKAMANRKRFFSISGVLCTTLFR